MPANALFDLADHLLAWLLTYGIHSSLLLAAAWLVSGRLSPAVGEAVWKAALVGGLFTASLQLALGHGALPAAPAVAGPSSQAMFSSLDAAGVTPSAQAPSAAATLGALPAATSASSPAPALTGATAADWVAQAQRRTWTRGVASFWILCAGALLLVLAVSYRRLRRRLADRTFITAGPVFRLLEGLLHRTGVARRPRLSRTGALQVPIAQGVLQPEICLPERALHLEKDEQESLLAHELAHLVRRDPTWLLFSRTLESLFFFQPLNFVARRKLQEIAELRCDDWAARSTGRPASLARCLTEVAGWGLDRRRSPAPAMATTEKGLRHRVCRLLQPISESRQPRWLQPSLGATILAFALIAPGVVPASEVPAPEPPEAPAAPEPAAEPAPAPEAEPRIASIREPRPEPVPESPEEPPTPPTPPKRIEGRTIPPTRVQVPEIRVPEVRVPEVHVPEIVVPEIRIPDMDIQIPEIRIPAFTMPEIQIPEIHVPEMDIQIPEIEIPDIEIPDVDFDDDFDGEAAARSAAVQEMAYARMEAVTAELAAVEEQLTRAHGEALRGALAAVEGEAAPKIAAFQQQVMSEIEPHLAALEYELDEAHREGDRQKAEAIHRARAEIERSVRRQMQQQERYVRAARQAAHSYGQELAQRHGEASQEHRERAQRELERVQEDLHRELEAQHEERARVMREKHERTLEQQHRQMEAARQRLERRLEQKERQALEREERALAEQQRALEEQRRALEKQQREQEKRAENQREAETAEP